MTMRFYADGHVFQFCGHVFSDWQLRVRIVYNAAVFVSSLNASLETKTDA